MAYELPPLSYPFNALEPHIDAKTMEIHHNKHHQAYITNANNALKDHPDLAAKPKNKFFANPNKFPGRMRPALRPNPAGHPSNPSLWTISGQTQAEPPQG